MRSPSCSRSRRSAAGTAAAVSRLDSQQLARLPSGSDRVLEVLRATRRPMGTGDLAAALALSRPSVLLRLRALQAEDLLTWRGVSAHDPPAVWLLRE